MKTLLTVLLTGALFACSSNNGGNEQSGSAPTASQGQSASTATLPSGATTKALHDSTMTFQAAQKACSGALGSVTFSLGHARVHGSAGVTEQTSSTAMAGVDMIVLTDAATGKTATIQANGHRRSVTGKNVIVKSRGSVACIEPDER